MYCNFSIFFRRICTLSCIKDFGQPSGASGAVTPAGVANVGQGGRTWERGKQDSPVGTAPSPDNPTVIVLGSEKVVSLLKHVIFLILATHNLCNCYGIPIIYYCVGGLRKK
jgi:hypothetical protein